jgi:hypothetical protein
MRPPPFSPDTYVAIKSKGRGLLVCPPHQEIRAG